MTTPRVTVLIGAWNNAATIGQAIDSILGQTILDLELIVVDDGSTDATPDVVGAIEDPRLRYLPLEHVGISRSLNAGVAAAVAPIVAIQDADDWSLPHRLERQLEVFERRPDVAVVGCHMQEVDHMDRPRQARTSFAVGDVNRVLLGVNPVPNTCAAFRRDVVQALGGYDPRYRFTMDYDLWARVAEQHTVYSLEEVLAVRRHGPRRAGALHEREQIAEAMRIKARMLRRRPSLPGVAGLGQSVASFAVPAWLKRRIRLAAGQAP